MRSRPLPGARDPGHRRRDHRPVRGIALAEATGGELVLLEGSGHGPHVRDPVKVNLLLRDVIAPPARRRAGCAARPAASARSTSPRRSASATPSATRRSPTSCASSTPISRSTGSRSTRSPRCSRHAVSASIRPAPRWPTSPATSRASRPSTTCTASRRSGGWTRSCSPTSWSSTTSSARRTTTSGSATRRGSSTTTCTRTPSRSAPPTSGSPTSSAGCRWTDGGDREAFLTADYNAEMIEHIARFPRLRDRAIFVGNPDDVVPRRLRPRPAADPRLDRAALRLRRLRHRLRPGRARRPRALGYRDDERVCIVTVGGSGVGAHLLRRVIAAFPEAKERVPDLRMIVVAGPRIDPRASPSTTASRSARTCTTCTATSPSATSRSSRAG